MFATLDAYLADHAQSGARQLYLLDAAGEQELDAVEFRSPFTLLFGPEWRDRTAEASPVPTGPEAAVPAAAGSMPDGLANEPEAGGATLIPTVTVRIPQINRVIPQLGDVSFYCDLPCAAAPAQLGPAPPTGLTTRIASSLS